MTALDDARLELMRRRLAAAGAIGAAAPRATTATDDAVAEGELGVAERRMWRIHELDPESCSHTIGLVIRVPRPLRDVAASVQELVTATPVLASRITVGEDGPRRTPHPVEGTWRTDTVWAANADVVPDDVDVESAARVLTRTPFRLTEEPAVRAWVTADPEGTAVVLAIHHIAVDGTSWPALLAPLVGGGDDVSVVGAPERVVDVDAALRHARSTWAADDIRHPITGELPDSSAEESWLAPLGETAIVHERSRVDPTSADALADMAREIGATPNALMIGICVLAAHTATGADDLVVAVPVENRRTRQDPRRVGYCGNIVPVRFTVVPAADVRENLRRLMSSVYDAMEHAAVDFGTLLTAIRSAGGRFPVIDVMASVRDAPLRHCIDEAVGYESVSTGVGGYPLAYAVELGAGGSVHLEVDHQVGTPESVGDAATELAMQLIRELPDALDTPLADLVDMVRATCAVDPLPERISRFATPGDGWARVGESLAQLARSVGDDSHHGSPLPPGSPAEVLAAVAEVLGPTTLPSAGIGEAGALTRLGEMIARHGLDLTHPRAAAHLQPPSLTVAVVADALASATNASLDTYDSGPATLALERWVVAALADLAGLGDAAGGVFGPGGSYSNLLALLVARDRAAARRGIDSRADGVGALHRPVVLCSDVAHFSLHRACAALGLGENAIVTVPTDAAHRMIPDALEAALDDIGDRVPVAIVATAGTTDFGTVDPLAEIAAIARARGVWLHVDAAYGFGMLFSDRLAGLVDGIAAADSITLDLHKVGWQPAAASLLLLADAHGFDSVDRSVAYLNPTDDIEAGYGGLLGQTLQTTRRPDVVKVAATVLAYGRRGLGAMLDTCHDLARHAEQRIATEPQLELVAPVTMTTVVFRYRCDDSDAVNAELRRRLIREGVALVGRTRVRVADGTTRICLKLTLLNPDAHQSDIDGLLDDILRLALEVESETATTTEAIAR